jgi:hypothetical protein
MIKYVIFDIRDMQVYLCQTMRNSAKVLTVSPKTFSRLTDDAVGGRFTYKNFVVFQNVEILKGKSRGVSL